MDGGGAGRAWAPYPACPICTMAMGDRPIITGPSQKLGYPCGPCLHERLGSQCHHMREDPQSQVQSQIRCTSTTTTCNTKPAGSSLVCVGRPRILVTAGWQGVCSAASLLAYIPSARPPAAPAPWLSASLTYVLPALLRTPHPSTLVACLPCLPLPIHETHRGPTAIHRPDAVSPCLGSAPGNWPSPLSDLPWSIE